MLITPSRPSLTSHLIKYRSIMDFMVLLEARGNHGNVVPFPKLHNSVLASTI